MALYHTKGGGDRNDYSGFLFNVLLKLCISQRERGRQRDREGDKETEIEAETEAES